MNQLPEQVQADNEWSFADELCKILAGLACI